MTVIERAEARARLLQQAAALADDLRENEAAHEVLLKRRAALCKELRSNSASIGEIQDVLGVSRGRVHQILRGSRT